MRERLPEVEFEFHAQRSPVVLDRIRSGNTWWGSARARRRLDYDLVSEVLRLEPMVLVPSALKPFTPPTAGELPVITIESSKRRLGLDRRGHAAPQHPARNLAGIVLFRGPDGARGLRSWAHTARSCPNPRHSPERCIELGDRGLARPVRFVARKSMFLRPLVQSVYAALAERPSASIGSQI